MGDTIMSYFEKIRQSVFDNLLQVLKNPVGHDIDVFYDGGNEGLYILTVDGVEMAVTKISEEQVHFDIPPTSVKKLISSKYKGEFRQMKDELVGKLGVNKFDNAMLTKCFLVLCTTREMDGNWGDIRCGHDFFVLMDDFIEKMEFYGAAKKLSMGELCKANPNFTLEDFDDIITVSEDPFDELDLYKYDPWAHYSRLVTKVLGFNAQGEYESE